MSQEIYRSAASVLLLRPKAADFEILLLHKPRKRDAWQLPQGGVEANESIEECALRELHEEAGVKGVNVLGVSETVYQYDFPGSYRRFRPDNVKGQHISFVFALAPENVSVRVDKKEVDRHKWVSENELTRYVRRKAYIDIVQSLLQEVKRLLPQRG